MALEIRQNASKAPLEASQISFLKLKAKRGAA